MSAVWLLRSGAEPEILREPRRFAALEGQLGICAAPDDRFRRLLAGDTIFFKVSALAA